MIIPTTPHSDREIEDYDAGCNAYHASRPFNAGIHSDAWQQGWLDAYEHDDPESTQ